MPELEDIRREIDEVDREMTILFERRMAAAQRVCAYKTQHNLPVLDAAREDAVVQKNLARLQDDTLCDYYEDFLYHLMALSRQYQTRLQGQASVAYQGVEGGFGHQVAATLFPHTTVQQLPTFAGVFDAVQAGESAFGVVPFENSSTGDVTGVLDLLHTHSCYISAMYDLPVSQNLLALPGAQLGDIKTVVSHEQALGQSKRFLESLHVKAVPFGNTALAARHVSETGDKSIAAIASMEACALYGLVPLAKDISTQADNATRFIIISNARPTTGDRFSLLITVENMVGTLSRVLDTIATNGFNMENIKSRPMPKHPWKYYFYIELLGASKIEDTNTLLSALEKVCLSVQTLGSYTKTIGQPLQERKTVQRREDVP